MHIMWVIFLLLIKCVFNSDMLSSSCKILHAVLCQGASIHTHHDLDLSLLTQIGVRNNGRTITAAATLCLNFLHTSCKHFLCLCKGACAHHVGSIPAVVINSSPAMVPLIEGVSTPSS
jgi:hypothetical protein